MELLGLLVLIKLLDRAWYWLLVSFATSSLVSCVPSEDDEGEDDDEEEEDECGSSDSDEGKDGG